MTITELARYVGVTTNTIRNWVKSGLIPGATQGVGKPRWGVEARAKVLEYANSRTKAARDERNRIRG